MPKVQDIMASNPSLDVSKQTKYFLRTLKTFLPTAYQSNDSNRMSLAFFTLSGLDLLGTLQKNTTEEQRKDYIDWIYSNQHPKGGFRAFPGANLGDAATEDNEHWDPANLPATFFALCSLLILDDDLSRVKRRECLQWLTRLQRPDGSFGETLGKESINGGADSRFGYCATGVRYFLRGNHEGEIEGCPDIDIETFVDCIRISEASNDERNVYKSMDANMDLVTVIRWRHIRCTLPRSPGRLYILRHWCPQQYKPPSLTALRPCPHEFVTKSSS